MLNQQHDNTRPDAASIAEFDEVVSEIRNFLETQLQSSPEQMRFTSVPEIVGALETAKLTVVHVHKQQVEQGRIPATGMVIPVSNDLYKAIIGACLLAMTTPRGV